jgi:hypothetical protein
MDEWQHVGVVGVDSGRVWIGDPAYFFDERGGDVPAMKQRFPGGYDELVASILEGQAQQVTFPGGHPGLGVWVGGFGGDGIYPVEIRRDDQGVAEVRVRFR